MEFLGKEEFSVELALSNERWGSSCSAFIRRNKSLKNVSLNLRVKELMSVAFLSKWRKTLLSLKRLDQRFKNIWLWGYPKALDIEHLGRIAIGFGHNTALVTTVYKLLTASSGLRRHTGMHGVNDSDRTMLKFFMDISH